ncbi:MAG: YfcE family phosphodiesterase [Candidatus Lokiarchaeota archaeon]|nr:YfcE family phosphodiesterase [Candidatus Lokiarchaeota archaeon]MBD3199693.1 YfcE family phosphodiesterase [Candidatus Lokiarchaeota archaeon]
MTELKLLILGDPHIPRRAKEIPSLIMDKLQTEANKNLYDYTFFTGDLIKYPDLLENLNSWTRNRVLRVLGNMDYYSGDNNSPIYEELMISLNEGNLLIGITHGSQIRDRGNHKQLESIATEKGYNILISGHTHKEEIVLTDNGILLLNPGSITGAWSFIASRIPSYLNLKININQNTITTLLFQLDIVNEIINQQKTKYIFENGKIKKK